MKVYREWMVDGHVARGFEEQVSDVVAVFFHGFTGNKTEHNRLFYQLANRLSRANISSIRFDWFGHGESDYSFADVRVHMLQQLYKVILEDALTRYEKVYLIGFSMGGALAMAASKMNVSKIVLMAPAYHISNLKHVYFDGTLDSTKDIGGIILHRQFLQGFEELKLLDKIKQYTKPILILQGGKDEAVKQSETIELHEQLPQSRLELFPDSDHCFTNKNIRRVVGDLIVRFLCE